MKQDYEKKWNEEALELAQEDKTKKSSLEADVEQKKYYSDNEILTFGGACQGLGLWGFSND